MIIDCIDVILFSLGAGFILGFIVGVWIQKVIDGSWRNDKKETTA